MTTAASEKLFIGVDYGHDEWASECVCRVNDDGTMTVIDMKRWRPSQDIDLKAERPDQRQLEHKP